VYQTRDLRQISSNPAAGNGTVTASNSYSLRGGSACVTAAARGARLGLVLVLPAGDHRALQRHLHDPLRLPQVARGAFKLPPGGGTQTLSPVASALLTKLRRMHHMSVRLTIAAHDGARHPHRLTGAAG
jgi:hypothetical protein